MSRSFYRNRIALGDIPQMDVVVLVRVPGPDYDDMVTAGNYDATTKTGYMGLVTSASLCSGVTLASDIGLSNGSSFNSTAGWLKFWVGADADCNADDEDKIVFIAKKTLRYNLHWDNIYNAGAVYGTGDNGVANSGSNTLQDTQVTYDGNTYKVRLLTGSAADPATEGYGNISCAEYHGAGSEWNDLLYRVHTAVPDCGNVTIGMEHGYSTKRHGGPQDGDNWETYSNAELQVYYLEAGDGAWTWCQERGYVTSKRVIRGLGGIATYVAGASDGADNSTGWRPCLELIQP